MIKKTTLLSDIVYNPKETDFLSPFTENKKIDCIVLAGGVAANDELRKKVSEKAKAKDIRTIYPQLKYCTDNAAMIALVGLEKYKIKKFDNSLF